MLVVVSIIGILAALLLPVLGNVRERGRRANCANNLHQLMLSVTMYGTEQQGKLPTGIRDDGFQHTPWVRSGTYNALIIYSSPRIPMCPNWNVNYYRGGVGYVIGYHYLGGHSPAGWGGTPWTSPQRLGEPNASELAVFADLTERGVDHATFTPHTRNGYVGGALMTTAFDNGVNGCNVGYLDGSVRWKNSNQMTEYVTCQCGPSYLGYW